MVCTGTCLGIPAFGAWQNETVFDYLGIAKVHGIPSFERTVRKGTGRPRDLTAGPTTVMIHVGVAVSYGIVNGYGVVHPKELSIFLR